MRGKLESMVEMGGYGEAVLCALVTGDNWLVGGRRGKGGREQ
jgi:hypothetical protein